MKNITERKNIADNCCAFCSKASCNGCPVKDLVSEDYETVVELLLAGLSINQIAASFAGNAV